MKRQFLFKAITTAALLVYFSIFSAGALFAQGEAPAAVEEEAVTAAPEDAPEAESEMAPPAAEEEAAPAATAPAETIEAAPEETAPEEAVEEESGEAGLPEAGEEETAAPEEEAPRILEISIQGNDKIATEEIAAKISLQVGERYDREQLEKDRVAIRDLGWFAVVQATAEPAEEGVRLVFRVVENEIIKDVVIEGVTVSKPDREDLLGLMKTRPGEVANQNYLGRDIAAIEEAYAKEGYVLAQVGRREISEDGVLVLTVLEGVITEVRITGNEDTRTYVIERELRSKPGQVYNAKTMNKDLNRIFNLGFFEDVRAHPEVGLEPGTVILVVEVVERKRTGLARFGGGWGSASGIIFFVDISKDNWRGTGQRISVRGQFGGATSYEVAYFNPWIAADHTSLNVSGYNRLIRREAFKDDSGDSFQYDERRTGGGLTLGRPLGETSRGFVTLRRDDLRVEDIDDDTDLDAVLFKDQSVRSLSLGFVEDNRDLVAHPTTGSRTSLTFETAGLAGGADFNKYIGDLRRYFALGERAQGADPAQLRKTKVIAVRLLAGTTTGSPPFLEQFLLGGGETLRGYKQDRFPGKNMLLLNTEYRFPISDTLQGVFFVDVGDAWGGAFAETYGDTSFTSHAAYGVGIQVQSPIGPLRLHYGIGSEGGQLHFGIGQMF